MEQTIEYNNQDSSFLASDVRERGVLLSIKDLKIWFELRKYGFGHAGYVHAVDGVSFDVHNGESIAVVGESGCGKSTLMKGILGLHRPTEGKIYFNGESVGEMKTKKVKQYRSHIGYIQQDPEAAGLAQDQVVEDLDPEELAGRDEAAG